MGFLGGVLDFLDGPENRKREEVSRMHTLTVSIKPGEPVYVSGCSYWDDPENQVFLSGSNEVRYRGLKLRRVEDVSAIGPDKRPIRRMMYEVINE